MASIVCFAVYHLTTGLLQKYLCGIMPAFFSISFNYLLIDPLLQPRSQAFPSPERKTLVWSGHVAPRFWVVTNKINVADVPKIDLCSYLA